jgi:hypothetical protein
LIVESKEDVEPKESIGLNEDIGRDLVTDKDIKEVVGKEMPISRIVVAVPVATVVLLD